MSAQLFGSLEGMATLTPAGLEAFRALEDLFLAWARRCGAQEVRYPALVRVADLDALDYFRNFPQLVMCACTLDTRAHDGYSHRPRGESFRALPPADLRGADYCLPPAACYNVYLALQGKALDTAQYVTTAATCFRNESHFRSLERLRAFTMREIVCVGPAETVKAHLQAYRDLLQVFVDRLGLPAGFAQATDPFFDKDSVGARAGRIFPTKEELVYDGHLAIGSLNYHRRFFGRRCNITVTGQPASTGCVAFGLERWIHALADHFGPDAQHIVRALEDAKAETAGAMKPQGEVRAVGA